MNIQEFRNKLQQIIDENKGMAIGKQIALINELRLVIPHTIKLEREAKIDEEESWRYNCFTFAFRLLDSPEFIDIIQRFPFLFANFSYASYLIERYLTEIDHNKAQDDDYIIYFLNGNLKHAGRIRNNRVISKWGMYHLWEHGFWEVPTEYGDKIEIFQQIPIEECVSAFKDWVNTSR